MDEAANVGSYVVSSHCEEVLNALPRGQVIVHVDLDYLINDLNGNPSNGAYIPNPALIEEGRRKLDHFFEALHARRVNVLQWSAVDFPGLSRQTKASLTIFPRPNIPGPAQT